jgi:cytochrome c556
MHELHVSRVSLVPPFSLSLQEARLTHLRKILIAGFALAGSIACAEVAATDPDVIARQTLMKEMGGAAKALGDMAGGKTAFDAAAAEAAKSTLAGHAGEIAARFEKNPADPGSEAKPEVWTSWDDFLADAKALGDAASALDVSSAETIGAGMGAIGGACKACHTEYRM